MPRYSSRIICVQRLSPLELRFQTDTASDYTTLRHSLSNWLVNTAHVNPKTVQEMLRHAKVQTTLDLYVQGDNDNKISAQDEFCGSFVDQDGALKSPQVVQ